MMSAKARNCEKTDGSRNHRPVLLSIPSVTGMRRLKLGMKSGGGSRRSSGNIASGPNANWTRNWPNPQALQNSITRWKVLRTIR